MDGWVKIHRALLNKAIWKTSTAEQKTILITILLCANYEQSEWEWRGEKYICEPGEMITSLESLAEKCGGTITVSKVRTALSKFEKYGFLTNESTKHGRRIKLVNWAKYQADTNSDDKPIRKQFANGSQTDDKRLADGSQTVRKRFATNKNNKNIKKEKKDKKDKKEEIGFSGMNKPEPQTDDYPSDFWSDEGWE